MGSLSSTNGRGILETLSHSLTFQLRLLLIYLYILFISFSFPPHPLGCHHGRPRAQVTVSMHSVSLSFPFTPCSCLTLAISISYSFFSPSPRSLLCYPHGRPRGNSCGHISGLRGSVRMNSAEISRSPFPSCSLCCSSHRFNHSFKTRSMVAMVQPENLRLYPSTG